MLRSYLKSAFRNLITHKGFTAVNILGLALGLCTCLLIVFYVADELSYDRYNEHAERIFRVDEDLKLGNNKLQYAVAMAPLASTLKNDFPQIEAAVRLKKANFHVKKGHEEVMENNVLFADPSVFSVFTLPLLSGHAVTALNDPKSIVITESMARKYFNRVNVVGQNLVIDDSVLLKVTGVMLDLPAQSHFKADFLVSMTSYPESKSKAWLRSNFNTYILMRDKADAKVLSAAFPAFLRKYSGGEMQKEMGISIDAFERGGSFFRMNLTPLTDIHLHSNLSGELDSNGTMQYIYILSCIAGAILLLACINFMNLSTARSAGRAREVGVRKVLGSSRRFLIGQFLMESMLVTAIAMMVALALVVAALPFFNELAGKEIRMTWAALLWLVPCLLLGILVIGAFAGSYPAIFLSGFQPIEVLKGKLAAGFKGGRLRGFLVVFQFGISVFLVIGTLVIYNQLQYIQHRDLGYNRKQVLIIKNAFELGRQAKIYRDQVKALPGVQSATLTGYLPTSGWHSTQIFYKDGSGNPKESIFPQTWPVDEGYLKTLDMQLVAGRGFSTGMTSDSDALVINETAARFLGIKTPLHALLYRSMSGLRPSYKPYRIIGIVKDFNFNSLRQNISPLILMLGNDTGNLALKVNAADIPVLLTRLEHDWKKLSPAPFLYSFMDADFEASYRAETRIGTLFMIFTGLAMIIACLGLFGLAAYAAEQRTREISIRKVLGADTSTIIFMLSKDFIRLVIVAIGVATPLAYVAMHSWLQGFAYRESIPWWTLVLAGLGALLIALLTVSTQTLRAATLNPVKGLKAD